MANSDTPFGMKPVRHKNGNPYNGAFNVYYVSATEANNIFKYDPVDAAVAGDTTGKYMGICAMSTSAFATTDDHVGVAVAFGTSPDHLTQISNSERQHREASNAMYVGVVDDPNVIFEMQEDGNMGYTAAGVNAAIVKGSGATVSGISSAEIDSSSVATTSGLPLKVLRVVDRPDNTVGTNACWEVMWNIHYFTKNKGL